MLHLQVENVENICYISYMLMQELLVFPQLQLMTDEASQHQTNNEPHSHFLSYGIPTAIA